MFCSSDPVRTTVISGSLVAVTLAIGSVLSILLYPEWDITMNSFSDLGDSMSPSKWIFNGACMLAGVFLCIFSLGYIKFGKGLTKIGGYMFFITGILLFLVGAVSKEVHYDGHLYISMIFAFSFFISASIICLKKLLEGNWKYLIPAILAALFMATAWILYLNGEIVKYGQAQLICFFAAFVWFLPEVIKIRKSGFESDKEADT